MVTSVGVFLVSPSGKILIGHPTHSSDGTGFWSIPKGKVDGDESHEATMRREFFEETGLTLDKYKGTLVYLDAEPYVHKKKRIVTFLYLLDEEVTDEPKCISFLEKDGQKFPEMDRFAWVPLAEAQDKLHYAQSNILRRSPLVEAELTKRASK